MPTPKRNLNLIKQLSDSLYKEVSDFRILYANRKKGIMTSKKIKGRYPQMHIRNILTDTNQIMTDLNNDLVARDLDKKSSYFKRPEDESKTRAYLQRRKTTRKKYTASDKEADILNAKNSLHMVVNLEKKSKAISLPEVRECLRLQVINLINLTLIVSGKRSELYNENMESKINSKSTSWSKVEPKKRIGETTKRYMLNILKGEPGTVEKKTSKGKTYLGYFFKLNNQVSQKEIDDYAGDLSSSNRTKFEGKKESVKKELVRKKQFDKKSYSIKYLKQVVDNLVSQMIHFLPGVNEDRIVRILENYEKSSLKYFSQILHPGSGEGKKLWNASPVLFLAVSIYRLKYIFLVKMKHPDNVSYRKHQLKKFTDPSVLLIKSNRRSRSRRRRSRSPSSSNSSSSSGSGSSGSSGSGSSGSGSGSSGSGSGSSSGIGIGSGSSSSTTQ